jgi:hypothetical protein
MKFTNRLNLPQALADAVTNDPYDNGGAWRSVTQLISPPRLVQLKKVHDDEIEEDVSDRIYSLYGQIVHQILQRSNTKDIVEERVFTTQRGKSISGGFDVLQLHEGRLIDWKFSTVWKAIGNHEEWTAQVNLLALLFRRKGMDINFLEIILLMRDHSKPRARREGEYPQLPVKRIPLPIWTRSEQECYLDHRVELHLKAEEELPLCTASERWAKPNIYAVMKKGNKHAIKGGVCSTREEAEELVKKDADRFLEVRPGENTRCLDYCVASKFCSQHQQEVSRG